MQAFTELLRMVGRFQKENTLLKWTNEKNNECEIGTWRVWENGSKSKPRGWFKVSSKQ